MKASLVQLSTQPLVTEREWTEDGIPVLTASCSLPQPSEPGGAAARSFCGRPGVLRLPAAVLFALCHGQPVAPLVFRMSVVSFHPDETHRMRLHCRQQRLPQINVFHRLFISKIICAKAIIPADNCYRMVSYQCFVIAVFCNRT